MNMISVSSAGMADLQWHLIVVRSNFRVSMLPGQFTKIPTTVIWIWWVYISSGFMSQNSQQQVWFCPTGILYLGINNTVFFSACVFQPQAESSNWLHIPYFHVFFCCHLIKLQNSNTWTVLLQTMLFFHRCTVTQSILGHVGSMCHPIHIVFIVYLLLRCINGKKLPHIFPLIVFLWRNGFGRHLLSVCSQMTLVSWFVVVITAWKGVIIIAIELVWAW